MIVLDSSILVAIINLEEEAKPLLSVFLALEKETEGLLARILCGSDYSSLACVPPNSCSY